MAQISDETAVQEAELELCAICLERPKGARLRPCGHDHFCGTCVARLFTCPLCRAPLLREDGTPCLARPGAPSPSSEQIASERVAVDASRMVMTELETKMVQGVCFSVWLFIFIFGFVEHMNDLQKGCDPGDPSAGALAVTDLQERDLMCQECSTKNDRDCDLCAPGYYNFGTQCFKYLENLPPLTTGAALGGTTYFVLIVMTQCAGILTEVILIRRLVRRRLMPRKELVILGIALLIEISRMFLVDIFVMQEYFGGRAYSVFRAPLPCASPLAGELGAELEGLRWQGADSQWYCDDLSNYTRGVTEYYLAAHREAWSADEAICSTFTTDSALLDFDEEGLRYVPGHIRFKTMGWVMGGEFALYYFFATFINELADNMFVVPTTTHGGWLCKIFSVALEVFQLGALCPAAVFTHKDCLHFTNPLGVSLHTMSFTVILFGYLIWAFVFLSLPLAVVGATLLFSLFFLCVGAATAAPLLRVIARRCCDSGRRPRCNALLDSIAASLERLGDASHRRMMKLRAILDQSSDGCKNFTMILAFIPMLCGGIFLGTLVVVGQASKKGTMQVFTAIVLLSDVLFKIIATAVTELGEFLLHRRVRRVVEEGSNRRHALGAVIGRPISDGDPSLTPEPAAAAEAAVAGDGGGGCGGCGG